MSDLTAPADQAQGLRWGRNPYPYQGINLGTGNRCGHNPLKPEFHLFNEPDWASSVPHAMRKLIEAVKGYYYKPLQMLPSLGNLNGKRNKSGDPRKNRSEARIAEALVMRAIIYLTEFASLRVGVPKPNGEFSHRSCAEIAAVAGLLKEKKDPSERDEPSERFWRAFRRLRKAGAFDVFLQHIEKEDGTTRALPAIKRLNENFLISLGALSFEQLKKFRTYCSNKLKAIRREHKAAYPIKTDAEEARKGMRRAQGDEGVITHAPRNHRPKAISYDDLQAEYAAQIRDLHAQLTMDNPDLSPLAIARKVTQQTLSYGDWLRERQGD